MNFSKDQFEHAKQNMSAENLKRAQQQMAGMTDEQLKQMAAMSGQNIDPQMMRQAASMFNGMSDDQINNMKNMASNMDYNQYQEKQKQANPNMPFTAPPQQQTTSSQSVYANGPFSKVDKYKSKGNEYFKKQEYDNASGQYLEAIFEVEEIRMKSTFDKMSQSDKQKLDQLEIACRMNYANVKAKQNDFELVQSQASEVLKMDKENAKGNFRMGQALFQLKKYQRAQPYLEKARKLLPNDATVKQLYADTQKELGVEEKVEENIQKEEEKIPKQEPKKEEQKEEEQVKETKQEKQEEKEVIIEEEKEEKPVKQQQQTAPQNPMQTPTVNPNQQQQAKEQLKNMTPEQMEMMSNQMKNMDNAFLKNILKQQTGMDMTDDQVEMYKNMMNPDTLKMMQNMDMPQGGVQPGVAGAGGQQTMQMPNIDPNNMDKTQAFEQLSKNPEMVKMAMNQMKQNPEMLKNMAKSMGPNNPMASYLEKASPEDLEKMMNAMDKFSPLITGGMKAFTFAKKNKYILLAMLVLIIAYLFF